MSTTTFNPFRIGFLVQRRGGQPGAARPNWRFFLVLYFTTIVPFIPQGA